MTLGELPPPVNDTFLMERIAVPTSEDPWNIKYSTICVNILGQNLANAT